MKLLVVSQYFWPENFKINDLVQELVARGHEVTVLTGKPNYPEGKLFADFRKSPDKFASYLGARIIRVPLITRGNGGLRLVLNYLSFAFFASILGPFRLRAMIFDCIFVFEPSPITVGLPAIMLRWLRHKPVTFWVQDLWPETLEAVGGINSPWILAWVRKLVSFIYNRCDLILAQSRSFVPMIACNCDHPERIHYFPNWAEPIYDPRPTVPAPEVSAVQGTFCVLFAGNIGDAQNFPAILEAAERSRLGNIRWLIVGDGRRSEWVTGELKRRGLDDIMRMLGRYPVERMPSFFKHADALLVSLKPDPILAMTVPAKLQTYLTAGIPILAMMDGEGAQLVERAGAGLACAAGDADGLAEAVIKLASMTIHERKVMGQRGRDFSIAEFDRDTQIDKLEKWLLKLRYDDPSGVTPATP